MPSPQTDRGSKSRGRRYTPVDRVLMELDQAVGTVFGNPTQDHRPHPDDGIAEAALDDAERREIGRLMRVNHTGEVSAQALYQGQSWFSRDPEVRARLRRSAEEEHQHLAWCGRRLKELDTRPSLLNPLFYAGSLGIGALAGLAGDRWSLGFVAETEDQVIRHIEGHLDRMPAEDRRSRAVLDRMKEDEARHGSVARRSGGADLPAPVRAIMGVVSRVMTGSTYYL